MTPIGKPLSEGQKQSSRENAAEIAKVEQEVAEAVEAVKSAGLPADLIRKRGQMTVWDRIEYLIDPETWCPLHTLYNPAFNEEGTTGVIDGLARIKGKWAVVVGFDNKVMAGAWIAGQADNQLRVTDIAKRLHVPLVWLVNCSGVKLTEQEEVYANRRGNGTTFYRHSELEKLGVPILAGIYGTNPAGGGYQGISPTILIAHKDANIAVGGGGIVSGMSPRGAFDLAGAEQIIEATRHFKEVPPGSVPIHYNKTGFFKEVYDTETGVLDALKKYMDMVPAYDPDFFRVDTPKEPIYPSADLNHIVAFNQKRGYSFDDVLGRIFDNSSHLEFRPGYGPEVYTGLAKINGLLMGFIGNRQGFLGAKYPEYAPYPGIGGKLYRQGLIKMNEFVTLCGRDRVPIVWFQDTTGIDVGDLAEKALREIPKRYRRYFKNVAIIVEDYPSDDVVQETGIHRHGLMGLFRGQAYGDKDAFFAIPSPYPDSIFLYQKNIESVSETEDELMDEIRMTMLHEVGHYFGLSEEDLEDFEENS